MSDPAPASEPLPAAPSPGRPRTLGTPHLRLDVEGPLAWLTFDRPEARNAITWAMYDGLLRACDLLDGQDAIRVLLLRGAGERAFVAGTDIAQFREFQGPEDVLAYERRIEGVLERLEGLRQPTITLIRGFRRRRRQQAIAHLRPPPLRPGRPDRLPHRPHPGQLPQPAQLRPPGAVLGPARTKQLPLPRLVGAEEALQIGLASRVVPADELEERGGAWP